MLGLLRLTPIILIITVTFAIIVHTHTCTIAFKRLNYGNISDGNDVSGVCEMVYIISEHRLHIWSYSVYSSYSYVHVKCSTVIVLKCNVIT